MGNHPNVAAAMVTTSDDTTQTGGLTTTPDTPFANPAETPTPHPQLPTPPNWPLLYGIVLAELAVLIVAFYTFTKAFA